MTEVRPVQPEEYDEAGRATANAYREFVRLGDEHWERYLGHIANVADRAERAIVLGAFGDGEILGSATLELDRRLDDDDPPLRPEEAHVRMLGVRPDARRRGVARALMAACEERAQVAGKTLMTLHTTQRMTTAQAMYPALGFRREPDRVMEDGFVLLTFSKPLGPRASRPGARA